MDQDRARHLRNELTEYASRWWAGEAEVARVFFGQQRSRDEHLRWLRLQAFKELQPRSDGIIKRNVEKLLRDYDGLDHAVSRSDYLYTIQFLEEEFRHYVLFADVIDYLTGERLTPEELARYELSEEANLREMRRAFMDTEGELARFASSFCEGGGASIFYEGMQIGGDPLSDRIAVACRGVYEDEIDHAEHGADELGRGARTEDDWARARHMVEEISGQRLRMRNEQFGYPLSDDRVRQIAVGQIDLPERFRALLV